MDNQCSGSESENDDSSSAAMDRFLIARMDSQRSLPQNTVGVDASPLDDSSLEHGTPFQTTITMLSPHRSPASAVPFMPALGPALPSPLATPTTFGSEISLASLMLDSKARLNKISNLDASFRSLQLDRKVDSKVFNPDTSSSSLLDDRRGPAMYNPMSNYSPSRRKRRSINISHVSFDRFVGESPKRDPSPEDDSDANSVNSEEALERSAREIRTELRQAEMAEIALEVEKAAAAGEEKFVGKPSTFGSHEDPVLLQTALSDRRQMMKPRMQRHRSYTEGMSIPLRRTSSNRIKVLALRDVNEVFPVFGEFHLQLRTHMARTGVTRKVLVFREEDITCGISDSLNIEAPQQTPRYNIPFEKGQTSGGSRGVGELVSGHLLDLTSDVTFIQRPRIERLPNLDESDLAFTTSSQQKNALDPPGIKLASSSATDPGDPIAWSSEMPHPAVSPRALFDDNESDGEDDINGKPNHAAIFQAPVTPLAIRRRHRKVKSDFLTPARLRSIRGVQSFLNDSESSLDMFASSGSILQDSTPDGEKIAILPAATEIINLVDAHSPLSLPAYNLKDPREPVTTPTIFSPLLPDEKKQPAIRLLDQIPSPSRLPSRLSLSESENNSICEVPRSGSSEKVRKRKVKVSVFSNNSPNVSGRDLLAGNGEPTLQNSQLISVENTTHIQIEDAPMDIICATDGKKGCLGTPKLQKNCGCLSLSPSSSISTASTVGSRQHQAGGRVHRSFSNGGLRRTKSSPAWGLLVTGKGKPSHNKKLMPEFIRGTDNDQFLHNYLYCSKPSENGHASYSGPSFANTCYDANLACGTGTDDNCCTWIPSDQLLSFMPKKMTSNISLSKDNPQKKKSDIDAWFDSASEHFDGILEHLVGSGSRKGRFNIPFRAPLLKKGQSPSPSSSMRHLRTVPESDDTKEVDNEDVSSEVDPLKPNLPIAQEGVPKSPERDNSKPTLYDFRQVEFDSAGSIASLTEFKSEHISMKAQQEASIHRSLALSFKPTDGFRLEQKPSSIQPIHSMP